MSNETTTQITDINSPLRFTVRADGTMVMRISGDTGNSYELSGRESDGSDVSCTCKGWTTWGKCYHVTALRARLAGEPIPARRTRASRKPSARRVSARPLTGSIVEPVLETAPDPTKKRRPSARRTH